MFENSPAMIIKANTKSVEVCKLELNDDAINDVRSFFSAAACEMTAGKTKIPFDGRYSPREDEYFAVDDFQLCDEIKNAIRNPENVPVYSEKKEGFPNIKAIFVGKQEENEAVEKYKVAFQCFRKEQ